ncbi:MAG: hypothetical protein K2Q25_06945 [Mycobacteriaceae bacterium]|nr:hypothetical protein [Mycobacteriaceae bacterium]
MGDNNGLESDNSLPSPPPVGESKPPPPPIQWETEVSWRGQDSFSLGQAVIDVVRNVIHGDRRAG